MYLAHEMYCYVQTDVVGKRDKIFFLLQDIEDSNIIDALSYYTIYGNFISSKEKVFKDSLTAFITSKTNTSYEKIKEMISEKISEALCQVSSFSALEIGIDLALMIEETRGNAQIRSYCSTLMSRISNLSASYSTTLFNNDEQRKINFDKIIKPECAFTILSVSSMNNDDLLFFATFLQKEILRVQIERKKSNKKLMLYHCVFDEAHRYITEDSVSKSQIQTFEKIAKEGRKFGIFNIFASQRPSELSKTVLSQCNNFIIHRIRNNTDLDQLRKSIPYINDVQIMRISYLKSGTALFVGDAFEIPLEIEVNGEDYIDISKTIQPSMIWKK